MKPSCEESCRRRVDELFDALNNYIQKIEGTDEKRASIAYCIVNLLVQNCDPIESLGVLEMIKDLLNHGSSDREDMNVDSSLIYIS